MTSLTTGQNTPPHDRSGAAQPSPLAGLRVVELATDPSGELTGLQLVHMGADVVKVEPPDGAPSRHTGPFAGGAVDPEKSLPFWYYNVGKRSVVVDLDQANGHAALSELLGDADVFICTLHPRELRRIELDLDALVAAHPRLVVVAITPFGLTGPWSDYLSSDLVGLAASGLLIMSGYDDHSIPPIRPGGDQGFHTTASFAHIALLLALLERNASGKGGLVDVSMHESAGMTVELANPFWFYPRTVVQRQTCRHAQPVPTQPALFECRDGGYVYFAFIVAETKSWHTLVAWMAAHDLALDLTDEKYSDVAFRQEQFEHIQNRLECFFLLLDAQDAYHEGQRRGLPLGVLNAPEELYDDEHLKARGFFQPVDQPGHGSFPHPIAAYRFSAFDAMPLRAAPALGQHTSDLLEQR